ncbi:hypothetical protein Poli38472_010947 [Pythium oligandrum]|uniref:Palmitoyltransferase n=1 Tax=Pythium oligandrum TaxID=41045 RepID=A0A8K1CEC4_PYTOL|nr:hypothetical protein Poli38472_010947 [Pythium oligandrum]|eukprot:TMW61884.1 hypothetical protein Poli38472_010947 [Pythium oligandrum]
MAQEDDAAMPQSSLTMEESSAHIEDQDETQASRKYHLHPPRRRVCCVRYGRTTVLYSCSAQYGYFPLTAHIGPNWPCMLVTYAIAIVPMILALVTDKVAYGLRIAMLVTSVITTVIFSMVACSDPGVVFESYEPLATMEDGALQASRDEPDRGVICAQCQLRRPRNASHCSDCRVCVCELDHHCPWTGKCIGKRTLQLFYAFLWCITIHIVLVVVSFALAYISR